MRRRPDPDRRSPMAFPGRHQLVGRRDPHRLVDARQQRELGEVADGVDVADGADDRALGAPRHRRDEPVARQRLGDALDVGLGGLRLHDDDHSVSPPNSSMRASHRPGASSSAGVGQHRLGLQEPVERRRAGPFFYTAAEGGRLIVEAAAGVEPEEPLDEPVGLAALDPVAAHGLPDRRQRLDHRLADPLDDRVGVALQDGGGQLEALEDGHLLGRLHGAEQGVGVEHGALQGRRVGEVDRAELRFEGGGVDPERRHVLRGQPHEPLPDPGPVDDAGPDRLAEGEVEAEVVGGDRPGLVERLEVRHDQRRPGRVGDGQEEVVLRQQALGQLADHEPALHAEEERPEGAEHAGERVGPHRAGAAGSGLACRAGRACARSPIGPKRPAKGFGMSPTSPGSGGSPCRLTASFSRTGRSVSRAWSAHSARPRRARDRLGGGSPVSARTRCSAAEATSPMRARSSAATGGSVSPSRATQRATWRATSQWTGPSDWRKRSIWLRSNPPKGPKG